MRPQVLNPTTCRTLLFLLPFCLSLPYIVQADDSERGSWAVQFRVTENFTLSSFGGSVLSLKKHISNSNAFRASVDLNISNNNQDITDDLSGLRETEVNSTRAGFGVDYLRYFTPKSSFSLFLGIGPFFQFFSTERTSEPGSSLDKRDGKLYGVRGIIGVEWFVTNRIGLHSEYGVDARYSSTDVTQQANDRTRKLHSSIWEVNGRSAFLGASVYF